MGRYEGELTTIWKQDGRLMELKNPFAFIDYDEVKWDVPAGAQIDGASIPQFLWSIAGSPYTGQYRDASVVHDWYCSVRTRSSDATHKMFFEAMLVSGVGSVKARIMYAAVRYAGPKWTQMDTHNANLASKYRWRNINHYWGPGGLPPFGTPEYEDHVSREARKKRDLVEVLVRADASEEEFKRIAEKVVADNLDADAIDDFVSSLPTSGTRPLENGLYRFDEKPHLS